uniref:Zinc finger, CCHC-type n=1 Tax=Tanacetum cinerariifolium TaxID=118510 RepID=A0A699H6X1_TANCI|nr:zinc finger, CCHC-type [Tanacetum cinerariifolium]
MNVAAMKHMASNFAKLDKFKGVDFKRWQKMHFLLSSMSVVYVLTTPIPGHGGDDATVKQIRKRAKWDNDDYVCRCLILKVSINSIIESMDDIFDENRFSSVPTLSLKISNGTEDIGGSVVPEKVTEEQLVMRWTPSWATTLGCWLIYLKVAKPLGCKWIFKRKLKVDETIGKFKARLVIRSFKQKSGIDYFGTYAPVVDMRNEFLSSKFSMKGMEEADVILGIWIKHESNGITISRSHYTEKHWQAIQRVLKYLKKTMDYRLTYTGYSSVLEGYTDASWISNTKDNSSTSGWVFLLGGGVIFWAFKKQTCITGSTIESVFVALVAAGKKAKWLKNLLFETLLWSKPVAHISIHYDSAATLAKAYRQMYNEKSRHLGVRHSMIRELITNEVVSIEFVRSQRNLADHFTKGLARDLVIKSAEWMGLKSN